MSDYRLDKGVTVRDHMLMPALHFSGKEVRSFPPMYVTGVAISRVFGVAPKTVWCWIKAGYFPHAIQVRHAHYSDTRPRITTHKGSSWLIPISDLKAWLREAPKALLRALERRGAELSPDAHIVEALPSVEDVDAPRG